MQRREVLQAGAIGALGSLLPRTALAQAEGIRTTGAATQGGWLRGTAPPGTLALELDGRPVALAPDGAFFIGFDRDAAPASRLVATLRDGRTLALPLTIAPGAWRIERVNAPLRPPALGTEAYRQQRAAELAQINAARAQVTGATGWRQSFVRPVAGRVTGLFGAQRIYRGEPGAYHSGTDFAATTGTPYVAPADGVVILAAAAPFTLEGLLLMIDHGAGLNSAFLHSSQLLVRVGDAVRQNQPLGLVGMTGRATGPHLHWGLKWRNARLDPARFF